MKWLIVLLLTFSCLAGTFAQSDFSSYKNIAGDTSIYLKDYMLLDTSRQDTLAENFNAGTYRIVLDQGVDTQNDVEITILNEHDQTLAVNKHEGYIDFTNSSASTLRFITYPKNRLLKKVTGKVFWVYSKNISKELPPFQIADIDGNKYNQESLRGKVVVFNFWGIQCAPCKKEIPQLNLTLIKTPKAAWKELLEAVSFTSRLLIFALPDRIILHEHLRHHRRPQARGSSHP